MRRTAVITSCSFARCGTSTTNTPRAVRSSLAIPAWRMFTLVEAIAFAMSASSDVRSCPYTTRRTELEPTSITPIRFSRALAALSRVGPGRVSPRQVCIARLPSPSGRRRCGTHEGGTSIVGVHEPDDVTCAGASPARE